MRNGEAHLASQMRYGKHQKKMVLMAITEKGIKVYPNKRISIDS